MVVKSSLVLIVLKRRLALYVYLYSYVLARIQHWCWQVQQNEEQTLEHLLKAGDKERAASLAKILSTLAALAAGDDIEDAAEFTDLVSALF